MSDTPLTTTSIITLIGSSSIPMSMCRLPPSGSHSTLNGICAGSTPSALRAAVKKRHAVAPLSTVVTAMSSVPVSPAAR